ncbi:MAG: TetR/AcrR family transcriptional regulator [Lachnospiraceae bacterium]|nr:TetR/AcrR family transcriptional regulator [Lachnospiraceae bacterium]
MEEKTDRRIRKTKSQLKKGLARLMMEKGINEISVKELVQAVDINRSTFYLHYSDIYSLLDEVEKELLNEIQGIIDLHPMGIEDNTFTFMEDIFVVIENNKEIFMALLGDHGDATFMFQLETIIKKNTMKQLEILFPDIPDDLKYTFSFCMSGCMGIVCQWIFENGQESPQHMGKLMFSMVVHALGIDKYERLLKNE